MASDKNKADLSLTHRKIPWKTLKKKPEKPSPWQPAAKPKGSPTHWHWHWAPHPCGALSNCVKTQLLRIGRQGARGHKLCIQIGSRFVFPCWQCPGPRLHWVKYASVLRLLLLCWVRDSAKRQKRIYWSHVLISVRFNSMPNYNVTWAKKRLTAAKRRANAL